MKLFQQLLVAPAALGLLAPLSASASEINLDIISDYSESNLEIDANSFKQKSSKFKQNSPKKTQNWCNNPKKYSLFGGPLYVDVVPWESNKNRSG